MNKKIFYLLIFFINSSFADTVLWCEEDTLKPNIKGAKFTEVLYLHEEFTKNLNGQDQGIICDKNSWFSDTRINEMIKERNTQNKHSSIETFFNNSRTKVYGCYFVIKNHDHYGWFKWGNLDHWRKLDRKTLKYLKKYPYDWPARETNLTCKVTTEEKAIFDWNSLEQKQIQTNKRLVNQSESENVL